MRNEPYPREWDRNLILTIAGIFLVALVIARRWVR